MHALRLEPISRPIAKVVLQKKIYKRKTKKSRGSEQIG